MRGHYRRTARWEEEARDAATAALRAAAKGRQRGQHSFGNQWDVRYVAQRLRLAADQLEALHDLPNPNTNEGPA